MRGAIYARVSKDDPEKDGESASVTRQIEDLQRFAETHKIDVVHVSSDDGISGTDIGRLAEIEKLLDEKAIDVLLLDRQSRLARNAAYTIGLRDKFIRAGVECWMDYRPVDVVPNIILWGVQALMDQRELESNREAMMRGKARSARLGHHHGGELPYGTTPVPCEEHSNCRSSVLVEDPVEADAIRWAWKEIVEEGGTSYTVAKRWNAEGPTPRRAKLWSHQLVKHLMKNPRLTGTATSWGAEIDVPAILTRNEYARLQLALDATRKKVSERRSGYEHSYPLTRKIICGCGRHWNGGFRRELRHYKCMDYKGAATVPGSCPWPDRRWWRADDLEKLVAEEISWWVWQRQDEIVEAIKAAGHQEPVDPEAAREASLEAARMEDALGRLLVKEAMQEIDGAAFNIAKQDIEGRLNAARELMDNHQRSLVDTVDDDLKTFERIQMAVAEFEHEADYERLFDLVEIRVQLIGRDQFLLGLILPINGVPHVLGMGPDEVIGLQVAGVGSLGVDLPLFTD